MVISRLISFHHCYNIRMSTGKFLVKWDEKVHQKLQKYAKPCVPSVVPVCRKLLPHDNESQ